MTLDELKARTAARAAAGECQEYPEHAGKAAPARPLPLVRPPCADLGERLPGQPCGSPLLRCLKFGDVTARLSPCTGAARCCATCAEYRIG